jgi:hypothetical protein
MLSTKHRCVHGPLALFGSSWSCTFCRDGTQCADARCEATASEIATAADASRKWTTLDGDDDAPQLKERGGANSGGDPWDKAAQAALLDVGTAWCSECDKVASAACKAPMAAKPAAAAAAAAATPAAAAKPRTAHRLVTGWRHVGEALARRDVRGAAAQFFFDDAAVAMVLGWLDQMKVTRVLCVGCPRIHEALLRRGAARGGAPGRGGAGAAAGGEAAADGGGDGGGGGGGDKKVRSVLLDLDERLGAFFPGTVHSFNMCNGAFIAAGSGCDSGGAARAPAVVAAAAPTMSLRRLFGGGAEGKRLAVLVDPPFGANAELLVNTVLRFAQHGAGKGGALPLTMLFSPWFHEPQLARQFKSATEFAAAGGAAAAAAAAAAATGGGGGGGKKAKGPKTQAALRVLRAEVTYVGNPFDAPRMRRGKKRKRTSHAPGGAAPSPVRCFLNLRGSLAALAPPPAQLGRYRLCNDCEQHVPSHVEHCTDCGRCALGHDQHKYHHCDACGVCVRADYTHCVKCSGCFPPDNHPCFAKQRKHKAKLAAASSSAYASRTKKKE